MICKILRKQVRSRLSDCYGENGTNCHKIGICNEVVMLNRFLFQNDQPFRERADVYVLISGRLTLPA